MIQITQKEYEELLDAQAKLTALESGGVDNWEWYSEAVKYYLAEKEKKEELAGLLSDLEDVLCDHIEEPAGRGCGYGLTDDGSAEIKAIMVKAFELGKEHAKELAG